MLRLNARLISKEGNRGREPLMTATLEFDADLTRIYSERLAAGGEDAEKWLAEHAEKMLLDKCSVVFKLEHGTK